MKSKIKNILIFVGIGILLAAIYFFFFKKEKVVDNLSSSNNTEKASESLNAGKRELDTKSSDEIKKILSHVKNINLDTSIFSIDAFSKLKDSSKTLTPTGDEGRRNPFAPIEEDVPIVEEKNTENLNDKNPITPGKQLIIPVFPQ